MSRMTLDDYLAAHGVSGYSGIGDIVRALARAAVAIAERIRAGGSGDDPGRETGVVNADGDAQKALDVLAEEILIRHLRKTPASCLLSEERDEPMALDGGGGMIVAVDPLDGSSNIDVNVTIGTIFSVMPERNGATFCHGRDQLAAGFFTYGPQTTLILALAGDAPVCSFVHDPEKDAFVILQDKVAIPREAAEYAINAAYARYWLSPVKGWMDEVLSGKEGSHGKDYRMRWVGSLVADAWRIFCRGGIFLYPADCRPGHENGRLRLVYEANPIAFLVEKAGGLASTGVAPILDETPVSLHQRTPLVFGSADEVRRVVAFHDGEA